MPDVRLRQCLWGMMSRPAINVMLSEGAADYYKERVPGFSLDTPLSWYGDSANVVIQCGMIGSFRSYRYGADAEWAFRRIDENVIRTELRDDGAQIVFR